MIPGTKMNLRGRSVAWQTGWEGGADLRRRIIAPAELPDALPRALTTRLWQSRHTSHLQKRACVGT